MNQGVLDYVATASKTETNGREGVDNKESCQYIEIAYHCLFRVNDDVVRKLNSQCDKFLRVLRDSLAQHESYSKEVL